MKTKKIIIINGYPRSGKDTFIDICNELIDGSTVSRVSIIDYVKGVAASRCGWTGEKTPKDRKFLCDFKKLLTEYNDLPLRRVNDVVQSFVSEKNVHKILFVTMREKVDIEKFKKTWPQAETLFISRREAKKEYEQLNNNERNSADSDVDEAYAAENYDHFIYNSGGLDDLRAEAKAFLEKLEVI